MSKDLIPLSVPTIEGNEWKYVKECLDTGWISSVGSYVTAFETAVADFVGAGHAVAVVNGTAALHTCLMLAKVEPGDYVIMPNITFVATANAVSYVGAEPILVDADPETWQMDLNLLEGFLAEATDVADGSLIHKKDRRRIAAVIPVHLQGNMSNMERLLEICARFSLPIIEDAAEAIGARYKGKHAGTFGKLGCFSFNGNKIISTGGGGMIVTEDESSRQGRKASHHHRQNGPHAVRP